MESRFLGMESEHMLTPREKSPLPKKFRGGSNLRCCIMQDSEPNTLLTQLFWPHDVYLNVLGSTDKSIYDKNEHKI